jgi:hypothetical protein
VLIDTGKSQSFDVVPLRAGGTLPARRTSQSSSRSIRNFAEAQRTAGGAGAS